MSRARFGVETGGEGTQGRVLGWTNSSSAALALAPRALACVGARGCRDAPTAVVVGLRVEVGGGAIELLAGEYAVAFVQRYELEGLSFAWNERHEVVVLGGRAAHELCI